MNEIDLASPYSQLWIIWLLSFVAIEGKAIISKKKGDTLSEHTWNWLSVKTADGSRKPWTLKRGVLTIFLGWLLLHLGVGVL